MYPIYKLLYECLGTTCHATAKQRLAVKCCADRKNENKARRFAETVFSNPLLKEPQIARLSDILNIPVDVLQNAARDTYRQVSEEEKVLHFKKIGPHVNVSFAGGPHSFSQAVLFRQLRTIELPENIAKKGLEEQLVLAKQAIAQYCTNNKQYFSLFDQVIDFTYWHSLDKQYVFTAEDFNG